MPRRQPLVALLLLQLRRDQWADRAAGGAPPVLVARSATRLASEFTNQPLPHPSMQQQQQHPLLRPQHRHRHPSPPPPPPPWAAAHKDHP